MIVYYSNVTGDIGKVDLIVFDDSDIDQDREHIKIPEDTEMIEPEYRMGFNSIMYVNLKTKELVYEYIARDLNDKEKLDIMVRKQEDTDAMVLQLLMEGLK